MDIFHIIVSLMVIKKTSLNFSTFHYFIAIIGVPVALSLINLIRNFLYSTNFGNNRKSNEVIQERNEKTISNFKSKRKRKKSFASTNSLEVKGNCEIKDKKKRHDNNEHIKAIKETVHAEEPQSIMDDPEIQQVQLQLNLQGWTTVSKNRMKKKTKSSLLLKETCTVSSDERILDISLTNNNESDNGHTTLLSANNDDSRQEDISLCSNNISNEGALLNVIQTNILAAHDCSKSECIKPDQSKLLPSLCTQENINTRASWGSSQNDELKALSTTSNSFTHNRHRDTPYKQNRTNLMRNFPRRKFQQLKYQPSQNQMSNYNNIYNPRIPINFNMYQAPFYPVGYVPTIIAPHILEQNLINSIRTQINDWYLRSFMDEEGFVSAEEIAKFHKIANMNVPPDLIIKAIVSSNQLELNSTSLLQGSYSLPLNQLKLRRRQLDSW